MDGTTDQRSLFDRSNASLITGGMTVAIFHDNLVEVAMNGPVIINRLEIKASCFLPYRKGSLWGALISPGASFLVEIFIMNFQCHINIIQTIMQPK